MKKTRRTALKTSLGLGVVSSLPSSWMKPVVESVILPAHAQTSSTTTPAPECNIDVIPQFDTPFLDSETIGQNTTILAINGPGRPIIVNYETSSPLTLSTSTHVFNPMNTGERETQTVDVLSGASLVCAHTTTVIWGVAPGQDCPFATPDTITIDANFSDTATIDISPFFSNPDGPDSDLEFRLLAPPREGSVSMTSSSEFTYQGTTSTFTGSDRFSVVATDRGGSGSCSRGTALVIVDNIVVF